MNTRNFYIQYHNADNLQSYPFLEADYKTAISDLFLNRPILLNKFDEFKDFKQFCGNFGIGFQCINKQPFLKKIQSFAKKEMHRHKITFPSFNKSLPLLEKKDIEQKNSNSIIALLNERMQAVDPQERLTKLNQLLRKDKEIVHALKKVANYRCQHKTSKRRREKHNW